jgi:hypothetical protein
MPDGVNVDPRFHPALIERYRAASQRGLRAASLPVLAKTGRLRVGRACRLCPSISDINLFGYCQRIIDLDTEIPDCAFDFGMPKQELDSS